MKKTIAWLLALLQAALLLPAALASGVDEAFAAYQDYGMVRSAEETDTGVYIVAEGFYGYHMDEDPSVTVGVAIGKDARIEAVEVLETKAQTAGFPEMLTEEYLQGAYAGKPSYAALEADAVAGATVTCTAVQYAVCTAAYYAEKVYGIVADTATQALAELDAACPAEYTEIETDYAPDAKEQGTVLYAAEGVTEDGTAVVGLKVRGSTRVNQRGSAGTGWDAAIPKPFTMVIIINKETSTVAFWNILVDGTREPDYFTVPEEKINAYMNVAITSEDVFDDYQEGLVIERGYETEQSEDGPVITGTTIVYTGATEQGEFSAQIVRNCFKTAAYFYMNYGK